MDTDPIPPAGGRAWLRRALYSAALAALFALVLAAGLAGNDFPSAWHNDEPGKIQQVRQGTRNLHHPPLMLEVVALAAELTGAKASTEAVAHLGRGFSGICLALAAVGLALLGTRLAGPIAGLLAGVALGTHPLLVECAHYFKEDSLHVLGLVAALLAGQWFADNPRSRGRAVLLGLGLALCVAAKHSGWLLVVVLAGVTGWLWWRSRSPVALAWKTALGVFLVAYLVLCWPMFHQLPMALGEILWELRKLSGGDYGAGTGMKTPHGMYLGFIYNDYGWAGGLLLAALLLAGLVRLAQARPREWAIHGLAAYSLIYLVALAFTAKFSDRYGIPLVLAASLVLGLGAARLGPWLAEIVPHRRAPSERAPKGVRLRSFIVHRLSPVVGLLLVLLVLAPGRTHDLRQRLGGFTTDSHADLAKFIRHHTPSGSVIAADSMALGTKAAVGSRRAVIGSWFAADLGSLADLSERGVRYVAFSRDVAHRYYETDWARAQYAGGPSARPLDLHRVNFYSALAGAGGKARELPSGVSVRLVWTAAYRDPKPLHPGLYLVELIPAAAEPKVKTPRALTTSE